MTPLIGIADVAKLLAVSKITIRRKVSAGELPCILLTERGLRKDGRKNNGPLRFALADVERYIQQHRA